MHDASPGDSDTAVRLENTAWQVVRVANRRSRHRTPGLEESKQRSAARFAQYR